MLCRPSCASAHTPHTAPPSTLPGEQVRITAVGASITSGAGGREWEKTRTAWPGYVTQFRDWIQAAFPRARATVHNAGMAGTFSGVFAQCFDTLIPTADIYILEQTTFDGTEPERCYCKDHYVNTPVQVVGLCAGAGAGRQLGGKGGSCHAATDTGLLGWFCFLPACLLPCLPCWCCSLPLYASELLLEFQPSKPPAAGSMLTLELVTCPTVPCLAPGCALTHSSLCCAAWH